MVRFVYLSPEIYPLDLWVPPKPPELLINKDFYSKTSEIILITLAKKSFSYLEEESQK